MATQADINKFYKEAIEDRFASISNGNQALGGLNIRSTPSTDVNFQEQRNSYYLKVKGTSIDINSADDLFNLTKMLATEQSEAYPIYYIPRGGINPIEAGTFPAGANSSDMEYIFTALIFPNIEAHYAKVLASPNLDDITKNVLKAWWAENQGSLYEKYSLIAGDVKDINSLSNLNSAMIDIRGIPNSSIKLRVAFFNTLFKKTAAINSNVLDALGFSAYLFEHRNDATGILGTRTTDPNYTLAGLELAARTNPEAYSNIVTH